MGRFGFMLDKRVVEARGKVVEAARLFRDGLAGAVTLERAVVAFNNEVVVASGVMEEIHRENGCSVGKAMAAVLSERLTLAAEPVRELPVVVAARERVVNAALGGKGWLSAVGDVELRSACMLFALAAEAARGKGGMADGRIDGHGAEVLGLIGSGHGFEKVAA